MERLLRLFAPRQARYRHVMEEKLDRHAELAQETRQEREKVEQAARAMTRLERELTAVERSMRGRGHGGKS